MNSVGKFECCGLVLAMVAGSVAGIAVGQGSGVGTRVTYELMIRQGDPLPMVGSAAIADIASGELLIGEVPSMYADGTSTFPLRVRRTVPNSFAQSGYTMRSTRTGQSLLVRVDQPMVVDGFGSFAGVGGGVFPGQANPLAGRLSFGQDVVPGNVRSFLGDIVDTNRIVPWFAPGTPAPGVEGGRPLQEVSAVGWPTVITNSRGVVVMFGSASSGSVSSGNGVWLVEPGAAPEPVAIENPVVLVDGATIRTMDAPVINSAGEIAILAESPEQAAASIWVKAPGRALERRFASWGPVVGGLPGEQVRLQGEALTTSVSKQFMQFNRAGRVAVRGVVEPRRTGAVFSNTDETGMRAIVRNGQELGGGYSAVLEEFGSLRTQLLLSDSGHLMIFVDARRTGSSSLAKAVLHHHPATGLTVVARPGLSVSPFDAGETIGSPRAISMNAFGDILWSASIVSAQGTAIGGGVWRTNIDGQSDLIYRSGQPVTVQTANGQVQVTPVGFFLRSDTTTTWERRTAMNDHGEFGLQLEIVNLSDRMMVRGKMDVCRADMGAEGAAIGRDGVLDNNDFVVFIGSFFAEHPRADLGGEGAERVADGVFYNNDFVVFVQQYFEGCE